jgi:signal transduction histidine kinase
MGDVENNKELQDFIHIVANELKTPIRGIVTLADWLAMDYGDKLDEQCKDYIQLLGCRAKRINDLIESILRYSQIGRVTTNIEKINLNTLIKEIICRAAPPDNIEITIEHELPILTCSQNGLMQILQNLLSNAITFMDKPQGQVKIGCSEEGKSWKLSVTDNGPGIAEKNFEKIFQIFHTLSPPEEMETKGVGLTLVKKIVELYGGKIWVESKLGQGSTFFFTIPKPQREVEYVELQADTIS